MQDEEEKKRNEEFERNNKAFCDQYTNDMQQRQKEVEKKLQSADASRIKGNTLFKQKKYDAALKCYMDSLMAQPFDVKTLTNIAQVGYIINHIFYNYSIYVYIYIYLLTTPISFALIYVYYVICIHTI